MIIFFYSGGTVELSRRSVARDLGLVVLGC